MKTCVERHTRYVRRPTSSARSLPSPKFTGQVLRTGRANSRFLSTSSTAFHSFFTNKRGNNMKRIFVVAFLLVALVEASDAQGWRNFFHPRPPIVKSDMAIFGATSSVNVFEFKPSLVFVASSFRPSTTGGPWETGLLAGAGPALTFSYSTQDVNGVNSSLYSASFAFLMTGDTKQDPGFQPALALLVGAWNNVISVGVSYDLVQRITGVSRFAVLLNLGLMPTLN